MLNNKTKHFWKPLISVLLWGVSFIATKIALKELEPLVIVLIRQILGASLLTIIALKQKRSFIISIKDLLGILLLALIAVIHLGIQVTGLQYTSASNTGWIIGITPVFMGILGLIFFKEKISKIQLTGIVISFIGLLLLVSKGNPAEINFISNKGDFLVLGSAFTWSVYSLVGKKVTLNYSPLMTILFLFITMSFLIAPFTITHKNINAVLNLSAEGWTSILFLGFLCSGVAYVLWAKAMSEMKASAVGAFLYIEPFVTVFAAWLLLNEEITFLTMFSGIIIIIGVMLVNKK